MKSMKTKTGICLIIFLATFTDVIAQSNDPVSSVINKAINYAGGADTWYGNGTLKVQEFQKRYEEGGVVIVDLTHTMNTDGGGYRIDLSRQGRKFVYGWDGMGFWATADGKPGSEDDVSEARRVLSNSYFRFGLPFLLERDLDGLEYTGTDSYYGMKTEVLKITYDQEPADRYFSGNSDSAEDQHSSENDHNSGSEHQAEAEHGGGNHHGGEEYFFHFADNGELKKVYFSHHGDGTYETLIYNNIRMVSGINRDHTRVLYRPDGNIHYESFFSKIEFTNKLDAGGYVKP